MRSTYRTAFLPAVLLLFLIGFSTAQVELGVTISSELTHCVSVSINSNLSTNVQANGTCFNVVADNIYLDCRGYNITGNGTGAGINATGRKNIIVRNCNIKNFTAGINFTKTNYSDIITNNVSNNSLYGISFWSSNSSNITSNNVFNSSIGIALYNPLITVYDASSSNNTLSSNNVFNNTRSGIAVYSSYNNTIYSNNVHQNGVTQGGIYLYRAQDNDVSSNSIWNNSQQGIYLEQSSNNTVSANNVSNNSWSGIQSLSSHNNSLSSNRAFNNSWYGLYLVSSNNSTISSNNVFNNTQAGVLLVSSHNNTFSSNSVFNNSQQGFYLSASSNNSFSSNNVLNNSQGGFYLLLSHNSVLSLNNILNNSQYGIHVVNSNYASSSNDSIADNVQGGIYFSTSNHSKITNSSISGVPSGKYAFYSASASWNNTALNNSFVYPSKIRNDATSNLTIQWYIRVYTTNTQGTSIAGVDVNVSDAYGTKIFSGSTDSSGLTAWATLNDTTFGFSPKYYNVHSFNANHTLYGTTIRSFNITGTQQVNLTLGCGALSLNNTLSGNVTALGTCFTFEDDNLTLDCRGYTVIGNGSGSGVNATGRKNLVIKNCNFQNFTVGINFTKTNYSTILNNSVWNVSQVGIALATSNSSNISSNTLYNSSSNGLYAYHSDNNSILFNNVYNNSNNGVFIFSSANNTVSSNNVTYNFGNGVLVDGGSGNTVSSNILRNNSDDSIRVQGSTSGNTFSYNNISSSFRGIRLFQAHNNVISSNNISNITQFGIQFSYSNNNTARFNNVSFCIMDGINGIYNTYSNVSYNRFFNNSRYGMRESESSNGTFSNNEVFNNSGSGLLFSAMNYSNFSHNNVYSNSFYGFYLSGIGDTVSFNNFSNNSWHGLSIISGDNNAISSNRVFNNTRSGILLWLSDNNTLSNNSVYNNSLYGVNLTRSNYNIFSNESISGNLQHAVFFNASNHSRIINSSISRVSSNYYAFYSVQGAWNNTVLNNSFSRGSHYEDATSNLTVQWYVKVRARESIGQTEISNANVTVRDVFSSIEFSENTSSDGITPTWHVANDSIFGFAGKNFNNHRVTAFTGGASTAILNRITSTKIIDVFLGGVSCGTINTNVTLSSDINADGTCMVFGDDYLSLNCDNHTITGSGSGTGIVALNKKNLSITNCRVLNFTNGIGLGGTNHSTLASNEVYNNSNIGIALQASSFNNLTNNTVYSSNYGIYLNAYSVNNTLHSNTVHSNAKNGFLMLRNSQNNTLSVNSAYNNSMSGVAASASQKNTFNSNSVFNNSYAGFELQSSDYLTLFNNTAYSNSADGFLIGASSSNGNITKNTAHNNSNNGFTFLSSDNSTLHNNTVYYNQLHGIYLLQSHNSSITSNNVFNNTRHGVSLMNSHNSTLSSNNIYSNNEGVFSYFSNGSTLSSNSIYSNLVNGVAAFESKLSINDNNIIENNSRYGLISLDSNVTANAAQLGENGVNKSVFFWSVRVKVLDYTRSNIFDASVRNADKTGTSNTYKSDDYSSRETRDFKTSGAGYSPIFLVKQNETANDSTTFDYNPHTFRASKGTAAGLNMTSITAKSTETVYVILGTSFCNSCSTCDAAADAQGAQVQLQADIQNPTGTCIDVGADNVVIECNGHVVYGSDLGDGVRVSGRNNVTVRNCVIHDFDSGINFSQTAASFIINNTLYNNSQGVLSTLSTNNLLENNTAFNSSRAGFNLSSASTSNTLNNNTAYLNPHGFYILSNSVTLENSTAYNNSNNGILFSSSSSRIKSTIVYNNNFGIDLSFASNSVLENNSVRNNVEGVRVSYSTYSTIANNTINNNSVKGLSLLSTEGNIQPTGNSITQNLIENNSLGVYITLSTLNNFNSNTLNNNTNSISFLNAYNNTVNSAVISTSNNGIAFLNSENNTVANSTLSGITSYAFSSSASDPRFTFSNTALNTTFDRSKVYVDARSQLFVKWYLRGRVLNASGITPIEGATVLLKNNAGGTVFTETTDSDGYTSWNTVTDQVYRGTGGNLYYNSHVINGSKGTVSTQFSKNVSSSMLVNIPIGEVPCGNVTFDIILANDVYTSGGTCFNLTANGITFDCNDHGIYRSVTGGGIGNGLQAIDRNGITIQNCFIQNFTNAIYFENTQTSTLYKNTAFNNTRGFSLSSSSNNNILENKLLNNTSLGVYLLQSSSNTLSNNNVSNQVLSAGAAGIHLTGSSSSNTIQNNSFNNNFIGFTASVSSNNNYFAFNNVSNSSRGIDVDRAHNNTFANNTLSNSTFKAVSFVSSNDNLLANSSINSSTQYDVYSQTGSNNTVLNTSISRTKIFNDANSNLTLKWYLRANVTDVSNSPIENSNVDVRDKNGALVFSASTSSNGLTSWNEVSDALFTSGTTSASFNNHTVNASKASASTTVSRNINSSQQLNIQLSVAPSVGLQVLINGVDTTTLENSGEPYNVTVLSNQSNLQIIFNETNGYLPFALPQFSDSNVRNYALAETNSGSGNVSFTVIPTGGQYADANAVGPYKSQIRVYYANVLVSEKNYTVTNRNLPLTSHAISIPNRPNVLSINDNVLRLYDRVKNWGGGSNQNITIYTNGTAEGMGFTVVSGKPAGLNITVKTPAGALASGALVRVIETNGYQPWAMTQISDSNVTNYAYAEATTPANGNVRMTLLPTGGVAGFDSFVGEYRINMTVLLSNGTTIYSAAITNSDRLLPEAGTGASETPNWNNIRSLNDEVLRVYDRTKGYLGS